ncbi:MAG: HD domain-containing protein [Bacteroidales bacterium]|jgi:poly(A) polymerase|nr:HD domain-containing protein [Bacteroidales bacterium]
MNISPNLTHPIFEIIRSVAEHEGIDTYVVGGYVRDLLLRRKDGNKDIDCMVVPPEPANVNADEPIGVSFAEKVVSQIERQTGNHTKLSEFKTFGTAMFHFDDTEIQFVGARKESYSANSRKPAVENGTLEDDLSRRDFTINAMAAVVYRTDGTPFGTLIDKFNGLDDLKNQALRTPLNPDTTFSDDPLRMLRAIRFASQLYFDIEAETFEAVMRNAHRIDILSSERITEEFNKILLSPKPSYGLRFLDASRLLEKILPEVTNLKGIEKVGNMGHKDNFLHTLEVLDNVADATSRCEDKDHILWLRWAALLHDVAKPATKKFDPVQGWTFHGHEVLGAKIASKIFKRLKLPQNEKLEYIKKLINLHLRPIILSEDVTDSAVRRILFDAGSDIDDLMLLAKADITSKNRDKVTQYRANLDSVKKKILEIEEKDRIRNFQPPVTGEDIIEYFNLTSKISEEPLKTRIQEALGKANIRIIDLMAVGVIKTRIKDAILDGDIENNREQAWNLMLEIGAELGLTH